MDQSLMSFYAHPAPVVGDPSGEAAPASCETAPIQSKVPVRHSAGPCSYGVKTGCQRAFRSKTCCIAVQDHDCDPPKEILPSFIKGKGPITLAQVYIAHGYHR